MRNQKGITLIALVVTIIVLLILAGVTIALLTGDNGILTNTNTAKRDTLEKQAHEEIKMALNSIKTEVLAQINKDSAYDPNDHGTNDAVSTTSPVNLGGLLRNDLTGLSNVKSYTTAPTKDSATGYYLVYTDSDNANNNITITYTNKENHFKVTGTITFGESDYANGGTIGTVSTTNWPTT